VSGAQGGGLERISRGVQEAVTEAVVDPRRLSSEFDVLLWRMEQFVQLGFSDDHALQLAGSEAELGQARSLINGGCPDRVALAILF
jgi:hypothetical protein